MTSRPRSAIRRLAASRLVSITGGAAAFTALNYEVYRQTGSPKWLALTLLLTFGVAGAAGPFAGALGDRFDRRRVMIVSDLASATVFVVMAFVHDAGALVALGFVAAVAEAPFFAASSAAVPNLIADPADLGWANGLVAVGRSVGILLGPVLGGVLLGTVGPQWVFAINAVSFVLSAVLVRSIQGTFADPARRGEHRGISAGVRFLVRERIIRLLVVAWMVVVLGGGMAMVADVPLAELFGAGSFGYGLMIALWGGGSLLGSLAGRFLNERNELRAFMGGVGLAAVSSAAIWISPWFPLVLGALAMNGFGDGVMSVADQNIIQRRTPDAVRSRLIGAADAAVMSALAVAFVLGGVIVAAVGPRIAYLAAGVTAFVAGLLLVPLWQERRRTGRPTEQQPELATGAAEQAPLGASVGSPSA